MASAGVVLVLWTAIISPLVYALYRTVKWYLDFKAWKRIILKLPGVRPTSTVLGHLDMIPGPGEEALAFMRLGPSEYPVISYMFYGPFVATVGVTGPQSMKAILKTSEPKPKFIGPYHFLRNWLGPGLLLEGGHKWARNRRLLTPAFHFDILKPYTKINNQCTQLLMEKMSKHAQEGTSFEVFSEISLLTLDVILRCAFSYESRCQEIGESHPYVKAVAELANAAVYRILSPWLYLDFLFYLSPTGRQFKKNCDFVHAVAEDIIHKRKQTLVTQGEIAFTKGRYLDFLDILLTARDEDGTGLTDIEIRDEVDTFLFEGHDTTASGISWTLYSLAAHPECMRKCQQEVDHLLTGRQSDNIEWEDLGELKYLTMCIKESLRLHTTVPLIQRQLTQDLDIEGYTIPKGTMVDIPLYCLHHNPYVWKDTTEYQPERFLRENMEQKDTYAYLPFSAGPRNCIGQNFAMNEMKIAIAKILRRFDLVLDPDQQVKHKIVVVMKSEDGIYMKARPRDIHAETVEV